MTDPSTPAATVRLSGLRVGQIVTLTGTVRTVTQLVPDDHRRVTLDCDPMDQPALPDDSLATLLADLDRAERRLAAVEGAWDEIERRVRRLTMPKEADMATWVTVEETVLHIVREVRATADAGGEEV